MKMASRETIRIDMHLGQRRRVGRWGSIGRPHERRRDGDDGDESHCSSAGLNMKVELESKVVSEVPHLGQPQAF